MSVLDHAVVATDSEEVAEVCRSFGAPVEMTSTRHPSGTDRVAEVAGRPAFSEYGVIANIQGDEPLLRELHLEEAISLVRHEHWDIGGGRALYFSRAPIPYQNEGEPSMGDLGREPFLRHIGVYAYTRDALARWVAVASSPLERLENLEQLRPLEAGMRIGVTVVGVADYGVDTPADVVRMENALAGTETLSV
jgi:3-deoxy-manno-octulosonate cytidylyltransferase (CMP-KDO synthetase)